MRWLPDYGVGIIAFGNLDLHGLGRRRRRGARPPGARPAACIPRPATPSAALVAARDDVSRLVVQLGRRAGGQDRGGEPVPRSIEGPAAQEIDDLRAKVGACTAPAAFDVVENALRGQWTMSCERGDLQVAITLAPTMPPRVQYLAVRPAPAQPAAVGPCVAF